MFVGEEDVHVFTQCVLTLRAPHTSSRGDGERLFKTSERGLSFGDGHLLSKIVEAGLSDFFGADSERRRAFGIYRKIFFSCLPCILVKLFKDIEFLGQQPSAALGLISQS